MSQVFIDLGSGPADEDLVLPPYSDNGQAARDQALRFIRELVAQFGPPPCLARFFLAVSDPLERHFKITVELHYNDEESAEIAYSYLLRCHRPERWAPPPALKPEDVLWSGRLFAALQEGGTWLAPRSGLVFERRGRCLVLLARMPHISILPTPADKWEAYQKRDFDIIRAHFTAAGIEVVDESGEE